MASMTINGRGRTWRIAAGQVPIRRRPRLNSIVFQKIPGRAGPHSLSIDIFLLIIDKLIEEAKEEETPVLWCFSYDDRVKARFVLHDYAKEHAAPEYYDAQKLRFHDIRLPLQISRTTRGLVHQHFMRAPMVTPNPERKVVVDAWVLPKVDKFRPQSTIGFGDPYYPDIVMFTNNLLLPPPQAVTLLSCIQKIHINAPSFIASNNQRGIGSLLTLPNLKSICCNVDYGGLVEDDLSPRSPGIIEIPALLVALTHWRNREEQTFMMLWPAFESKGVKLLGRCLFGDEHPILEVLRTPYGMRIRYLDPEV